PSFRIDTLAGKLVHRPVGSARLVPVRVSSRVVPRWMPSGTGILSVGACGLALTVGSFCALALAVRVRMANRDDTDHRRQWGQGTGLMMFLSEASLMILIAGPESDARSRAPRSRVGLRVQGRRRRHGLGGLL